MPPKLKDPNAPPTDQPTVDWGAQVEEFGRQLNANVLAADNVVKNLYIPAGTALTKDPDTGLFWDGMYPENLSRLEPQTLAKYLQMAVSEMMRFHRLVVDLGSDVDNAVERIDYIKDALGGSVPGGNEAQRKGNTTTSPLLVKEKLARVYYKRMLERAKFGYKYHAEYRELIDSLLDSKNKEKFRSGALGDQMNKGYVSPFSRQYQQGAPTNAAQVNPHDPSKPGG